MHSLCRSFGLVIKQITLWCIHDVGGIGKPVHQKSRKWTARIRILNSIPIRICRNCERSEKIMDVL